MKTFAQTYDVDLAAILAVVGVPIVTEPLLDERTGKVSPVMRIGLVPVDAAVVPDVKGLLKLLKRGTLLDTLPEHPAAAAALGLWNADRLAEIERAGGAGRLFEVGRSARCFYDASAAGWERPVKGMPVVATRDRAMAAALGVCGHPVCGLGEGRWTVWEAAYRFAGTVLAEPVGASVLVQGWRDGTLKVREPWHPLVLAMQAQAARDELRRWLHNGEKLVALRPPGTQRKVVVRETISDRAMDEVVAPFLGC